MSEGAPAQEDPQRAAGGDTEEIDALPVPFAAAPVQQRQPPPPGRLVQLRAAPVAQAAAVAAGSFVAGAAVASIARRRRQARAPLRRGRSVRHRSGELMQILSTRSLLLDVHLLSPTHPGPQRGR